MTTDIVPFANNLPALPSDDHFSQKIGAADYLGYIILHASQGKYSGPDFKISGGSFVYVNNNEPVDLGESVDVALLTYRMLAMRYGGESNERIYDVNDPKFDEFCAKAKINDYQDKDGSRYYWGVEYLIYEYGSEKFCTLYCNNKTLQRLAKEKLHDYMRARKVCTLTSTYIDNKKHKWWGALATDCSVAHAPFDEEEAIRRINEFNNPTVIKEEETGTPAGQENL